MCTSSRCHSIALLGMDACIPQSQRKRWRMNLQACLSHAQQREMITSAGQVRRCCTGTTKRHMFLEVLCHLIRRARATSCYNYTNPWALSSTAVFFCERARGGSEPKSSTFCTHTERQNRHIPQPFTLKHSEYQRGMVVIGKKTPPAQTRRKLPHNAQTRFFLSFTAARDFLQFWHFVVSKLMFSHEFSLELENLLPQNRCFVRGFRQFSSHLTKCHACHGICTLSPFDAALPMRFAKNTSDHAMDTSKVIRLPRTLQRIFWNNRKSIAPT